MQQPQNSETDKLRKRLNRLEVGHQRRVQEESRARAVTAGLSGGAVALFLSMSLPWVRGGTDLRYEVPGDADDAGDASRVLSLGQDQAVATGWELLGVGALTWIILPALVLAVLALVGLFVSVRGLSLFTVFFAAVPPVLSMLPWPQSASVEGTSVGPGLGVMLVGCLVVGLSSYRSTHDGSRDQVVHLDSSGHAR
ncbi:hypothetical protein [Nocardiopsis prasina]|uniref:hypothetical protein n=1 Tax=Nocardiopsis prasina TaxID=2015 RepID=UPI00034DF4C4|nr:hypothetical protein [Nocardiopsis prasina]